MRQGLAPTVVDFEVVGVHGLFLQSSKGVLMHARPGSGRDRVRLPLVNGGGGGGGGLYCHG